MNINYVLLKNNNDVSLSLYKKKVKQLKEELLIAIEQNREITEEILKLKRFVSQNKENVYN